MTWSYSYDIHLWPAIFCVALVTFLGFYSWNRRSVPGAKAFFVASLVALLWSLGTVLEISAADFSTKVFWYKFQVVWQLPAATAIFCFVLAYASLGRWLTRRNLIFLAIPSVLCLAAIVTNDYHHLFWTEFRADDSIVPFPAIVNRIFLYYGYLLALINLAVLVWLAVRSPQHRWPVAVMLSGQIIGRSLFLLNNIRPPFLDTGESVLIVVGFISSMYAVALFRFHVFDPVPLARSSVIEQMKEGMLVLDLQGRIVDLNNGASRILEKSVASLKGKSIAAALPALNLSRGADNLQPGTIEFTLGSEKDIRYYVLNISPLVNKRDQVLGQLLLLHELTDLKRTQREILEQQQAVATLQERERLARELHDSTAQVLGYMHLQTETVRKWLKEGNVEKADSSLARLAEVAKGAHTDIRESILKLKAAPAQGWSFLPTLRQYLEDFQAQCGIHTKLAVKDGFEGDTFKPEAQVQLLRVIQEALTNARKHSNAHNVLVDIEKGESYSRITVTDDGTGFDPVQLKQGSDNHFGLAFMNERMSQIHGHMKVESHPGEGTVVKLEVPD